MIRGVSSIFLAPLLFSPASPNSYSSIEWIVARNWCRKRGVGLCKGHVWFANGFYGKCWDIMIILRNVLGLFTVENTEECSLTNEWSWRVHLQACWLGMWGIKGTNDRGRGADNAYFSQKDATITILHSTAVGLIKGHSIIESMGARCNTAVAVMDSRMSNEQFLDPLQYVLCLYSMMILILHIVQS